VEREIVNGSFSRRVAGRWIKRTAVHYDAPRL
jgi:hypothetical protein